MIEIIKATYGGVDCTEEVERKVRNGNLIIKSDNNIIGDTKQGFVKTLFIEYILDGVEGFKETKEGDNFVLKSNSYSKLGIFIQTTIIRKHLRQ